MNIFGSTWAGSSNAKACGLCLQLFCSLEPFSRALHYVLCTFNLYKCCENAQVSCYREKEAASSVHKFLFCSQACNLPATKTCSTCLTGRWGALLYCLINLFGQTYECVVHVLRYFGQSTSVLHILKCTQKVPRFGKVICHYPVVQVRRSAFDRMQMVVSDVNYAWTKTKVGINHKIK